MAHGVLAAGLFWAVWLVGKRCQWIESDYTNATFQIHLFNTWEQ